MGNSSCLSNHKCVFLLFQKKVLLYIFFPQNFFSGLLKTFELQIIVSQKYISQVLHDYVNVELVKN